MRRVGKVGWFLSHTAVDELLSNVLCPPWLTFSWTNSTWDTLLLQQEAAYAYLSFGRSAALKGTTQLSHTWLILLRLKVHGAWIIFAILVSLRCKIGNLCGLDLMCKLKQNAPTWAEKGTGAELCSGIVVQIWGFEPIRLWLSDRKKICPICNVFASNPGHFDACLAVVVHCHRINCGLWAAWVCLNVAVDTALPSQPYAVLLNSKALLDSTLNSTTYQNLSSATKVVQVVLFFLFFYFWQVF